jgi:sRNA-binding protein
VSEPEWVYAQRRRRAAVAFALFVSGIAFAIVLLTTASGGFDLDGSDRGPLAQPDAEEVLRREREQLAAEKREREAERRERAEEKRRPDPATEEAEPGLDGPKPATGSDPETAEAPDLPQPAPAPPSPAPAATPQPSPAPAPSGPVDPRFYGVR